jgi:hypothetical protein
MDIKKFVQIMIIVGTAITGVAAVVSSVIDGVSKLDDNK